MRLDPEDGHGLGLRSLVRIQQRNWLAANFLQSVLTSDPEGTVGHLAPLAAYDAARDRVLVIDPDRRWYEPYWVAVDKLVEALAVPDPVTGRPRGLIRVRRGKIP